MAERTPHQLAARAIDLVTAVYRAGFKPAEDPTDLLLLSIVPLVIKKVRLGDCWSDVEYLNEVVESLDLRTLTKYITTGKV